MYKLLSDYELKTILEQIPDMNLELLEEFYDALKKDILRRANLEQRQQLYNTFVRWYKIKCRMNNVSPNKEILNKDNWINAGKPFFISKMELRWINNILDRIDSIDDLNEYYDFITKNVYPRASANEITQIDASFAIRRKQIEMANRHREEMKKMLESEEYRHRPPVGARVKMHINGEMLSGVVINRAYTTPDVQVRWGSGEINWVAPKYLEW